MRPSRFVSNLVVEHNDCARPLRRNGVLLEKSDATSVQEVYVQWTALLYDIGILPLDCDKRIVRHILRDIYSRDVMSVLNAFADALSCLLTQKHGFKAHVKLVSPHLWQFIRPMWEQHLDNSIDSTRKLIQMLSYSNRLSLKEIDLTEESIADYLQNEESISGNEINNSYIPGLKKIIKRWVKDIKFDNLRFKHGRGGVAEFGRTSIQKKDENILSDHLIRYAFDGPHSIVKDPLLRQSQTIFVAKNYKSFRTISMETPTLMYYQQGVLSTIDDHIERTRYLRDRIGTHDQTRNQLLACEGSLLRNYATIDLSAASDSVTWKLVKSLFSGTDLYRYLIATRSRTTSLPDGTILPLKKYAPMGSALNFPIQTLIYACVCEFVMREHSVFTDYSVYGDDIIVPTDMVSDVSLILYQLGFTINMTKSFVDRESPFRESCGGEYWCGHDVTPMRVSRSYTSHAEFERFVSLYEGANEAGRRGFMLLRQVYLQKLISTGAIPYYASTALESSTPSNYHTDRRWNWRLQRYEARVSMLETKWGKTQCESIRYQHWLRVCQDRKQVLEPFVSNVSKSTVYVTEKWMPIETTSYQYPLDIPKNVPLHDLFL